MIRYGRSVRVEEQKSSSREGLGTKKGALTQLLSTHDGARQGRGDPRLPGRDAGSDLWEPVHSGPATDGAGPRDNMTRTLAESAGDGARLE